MSRTRLSEIDEDCRETVGDGKREDGTDIDPANFTLADLKIKLVRAAIVATDPSEIRKIAAELRKYPEFQNTTDEDDLPENPIAFVEHLCRVCNLPPEEVRERYGLGAVLTPVMQLFKISNQELINYATTVIARENRQKKRERENNANNGKTKTAT